MLDIQVFMRASFERITIVKIRENLVNFDVFYTGLITIALHSSKWANLRQSLYRIDLCCFLYSQFFHFIPYGMF
jgi:hypothetical protein